MIPLMNQMMTVMLTNSLLLSFTVQTATTTPTARALMTDHSFRPNNNSKHHDVNVMRDKVVSIHVIKMCS